MSYFPGLALTAVLTAGPFSDVISRSVNAWDVPGVAVVVVRGGEVIHLRGYGLARHGATEPVTPDTPFPLASCSKAFTTTLMAMLADEGRLRFDDRVRRHMPGFRLADPLADAEVTLRDLVSHRTGIGTHDLLWYRAPWGTEEMVRRVGRLKPEHSFRAAFEYQSVMVTAAGLAAARAAGRPWDALVRERIFRPLGMTSAGCRTTDILESARPSGHRRRDDGTPEVLPWYEITEPNPAGSVHASARDLGAWLRFHLADGVFDGERLCSAANLRTTRSPQTIIPLEGLARRMNPDTHQLSYAMGWVVQDYRGRLMVQHGGAIDGFRAHVTLLPEIDAGFAILSNLHGTRMNQALGNALADALFGLPAKDWDRHFLAIAEGERKDRREKVERLLASRVDDTEPMRPLADYAGTYRHPAYGEFTVSFAENGLAMAWSGFRCRLAHFHYDTFRPEDEFLFGELNELCRFRFGPDGEPSGLRMFGLEFRRGG